MYYIIEETLKETEQTSLLDRSAQFVAVLTPAEWNKSREGFDMGIDLEPEIPKVFMTKAEVNYDSLTGTFSIPDRKNLSGDDLNFAFALDEKGIVFIDDSGAVQRIIDRIRKSKKWRLPSLERFIYDFLDQIVKDDLQILEGFESRLNEMEKELDGAEAEASFSLVNEIRSDIRTFLIHYDQLMDLAQELEENENNFFNQENLRYFHLFMNRVQRLHDTAASLRDYTIQIRDMYKAHLDIKQNRIMTVLTVVTTIFMPLTLIAGWYGMNFIHMPELAWRWSYPVVILVCIFIVVASLWFFKKKKWL
ncbi:MAG: magnesium transporter CorA [Lachnospiraceae bacterium]|nr:magnesium transporter CorA [Lachnospiraceae bacterium]